MCHHWWCAYGGLELSGLSDPICFHTMGYYAKEEENSQQSAPFTAQCSMFSKALSNILSSGFKLEKVSQRMFGLTPPLPWDQDQGRSEQCTYFIILWGVADTWYIESDLVALILLMREDLPRHISQGGTVVYYINLEFDLTHWQCSQLASSHRQFDLFFAINANYIANTSGRSPIPTSWKWIIVTECCSNK